MIMDIEDMPDFQDFWSTQEFGAIPKHRVNHLLALFRMAVMKQTPQGHREAIRLAHELWRAIERLPVQLSVSESGRYW